MHKIGMLARSAKYTEGINGVFYAVRSSRPHATLAAAIYAILVIGPLWDSIGYHSWYIAAHIGLAEQRFFDILQPESLISFVASEPAWKVILYGLSLFIHEDTVVLRVVQFYALLVFAFFLFSRSPKRLWLVVLVFLGSVYVLNHVSTARHFLALAFSLQGLMVLDRLGLKAIPAYAWFLLSALTHYHFIFLVPLICAPYVWLNRDRFSGALKVLILSGFALLFLIAFLFASRASGVDISPESSAGGAVTSGIGWFITSIIVLGIILLSKGMGAYSPHALILGVLYVVTAPVVSGSLASRTLIAAIPFLTLAICQSQKNRGVLILLGLFLVLSRWALVDWPVNFSQVSF